MPRKTKAELEREIADAIRRGNYAPAQAVVRRKWDAAVAAHRRVLAKIAQGEGSDCGDDVQTARRSRDRLGKILTEMAKSSPLGSYLDPAVVALDEEMRSLPRISDVAEQGRTMREKARNDEIRRLRDEQVEARRPFDWMRH